MTSAEDWNSRAHSTSLHKEPCSAEKPAQIYGGNPLKMSLFSRGLLEPEEYEYLLKYFQQVLWRIERSRAKYGMGYMEKTDRDFISEIDDELADVAGWAAMRYVRIAREINAKLQKEAQPTLPRGDTPC